MSSRPARERDRCENQPLVAVADEIQLVTPPSPDGVQVETLSLAAPLLHQPRLLLLDEPTVGVDPVLRRDFWEHFRSLAAGGVTILVSSHVMDEASRCDRLGLIRSGRVLAEGTARELVARAGTSDLESAFLALATATA